MPLKFYRPTTSARRHTSVDAFSDITGKKPERTLIKIKKERSGRNSQGKITVRHRGGGAKRFLRDVDFLQDRYDMPAKVVSVEYDPSRSARIALLHYDDGIKRYIIVPKSLKVGDRVTSSKNRIAVEVGNRMPLEQIPVGIDIYNVEIQPGKGGQIARSAGTMVKIMAVEGRYAHLRLPSGETRLFLKECMASVGGVGNADHMHIRYGKAGRTRHRGIRPTVRGKVMNPVDHPHGGGEGKNPIGMKYPKTPWGKHALGVKTRKKKASDRLILQRRSKRKR